VSKTYEKGQMYQGGEIVEPPMVLIAEAEVAELRRERDRARELLASAEAMVNTHLQARLRAESKNMSLLDTLQDTAEAFEAVGHDLEQLPCDLFEAIKHGDEGHQAWLADALNAFFSKRAEAAKEGR
jgi:bacterioferritin (cytochrome b1)